MADSSFLKRIKEFGQTIRKSSYDMEFYRGVRTRPWTRGLVYFLKIMAILTVVMVIVLGPSIYIGMKEAKEYTEEKIPDGASLTVMNGQLSAALPMPFVFNNKDEDSADEKGTLILDTSVEGMDMPRDQIGEDGVLIGKDAIFFRTETEERVYTMKDFPNISLNKRQFIEWVGKYIMPVSIALTLVLGIFYFAAIFLGNFIFVLFGASITYLFSRIFKIKLDYKQWLTAGFYAITLPLVLSALFDVIGWQGIPVFPVVFFMIMASVMVDEKAQSTNNKEEKKTEESK